MRSGHIANTSSTTESAVAILEKIDQVAHWLPPREPKRGDVIDRVAQISHGMETAAPPSTHAILMLLADAQTLTSSPIRTALVRRVGQLCELYGLVAA